MHTFERKFDRLGCRLRGTCDLGLRLWLMTLARLDPTRSLSVTRAGFLLSLFARRLFGLGLCFCSWLDLGRRTVCSTLLRHRRCCCCVPVRGEAILAINTVSEAVKLAWRVMVVVKLATLPAFVFYIFHTCSYNFLRQTVP